MRGLKQNEPWSVSKPRSRQTRNGCFQRFFSMLRSKKWNSLVAEPFQSIIFDYSAILYVALVVLRWMPKRHFVLLIRHWEGPILHWCVTGYSEPVPVFLIMSDRWLHQPVIWRKSRPRRLSARNMNISKMQNAVSGYWFLWIVQFSCVDRFGIDEMFAIHCKAELHHTCTFGTRVLLCLMVPTRSPKTR